MDALRARHAEMQKADHARSALFDDLLQQLNDMQKTMDRNAFVLVLIDGDCMNFLDELVTQRIGGGEEAAKLLIRAVFDYLRHDENFKHDYKIVIRAYANIRGLSKTYVDKGILTNTAAFSEFVLGFNKAHPLCDFVDAGNHKEAADTKLKEMLNLYVHNVHCKNIIFGGSADNGYASFLNSLSSDTNVLSRVRLLKGPPFPFEFQNIIPKFRVTEFRNVFRTALISDEQVQHRVWRRSREIEPPFTQESSSSAPSNNTSALSRSQLRADLSITDTTIDPLTLPVTREPVALLQQNIYEIDQDSDEDSVSASAGVQQQLIPTVSTAFSGLPTLPQPNERPTADVIEAALIIGTNQQLQQSPRALDFGSVKQRAEEMLGLAPSFWGNNDRDDSGWFLRSKNIIKRTVEEWVERTDNPPPKNATWMLRYFASDEGSPSTVMRSPASNLWRIAKNPTFCMPDTSIISPLLSSPTVESSGTLEDSESTFQKNLMSIPMS